MVQENTLGNTLLEIAGSGEWQALEAYLVDWFGITTSATQTPHGQPQDNTGHRGRGPGWLMDLMAILPRASRVLLAQLHAEDAHGNCALSLLDQICRLHADDGELEDLPQLCLPISLQRAIVNGLGKALSMALTSGTSFEQSQYGRCWFCTKVLLTATLSRLQPSLERHLTHIVSIHDDSGSAIVAQHVSAVLGSVEQFRHARQHRSAQEPHHMSQTHDNEHGTTIARH